MQYGHKIAAVLNFLEQDVKAEIFLLNSFIQSEKEYELEVVVLWSLSRGSELRGAEKQGLESNLFKRKENFIYLGLLICSSDICAQEESEHRGFSRQLWYSMWHYGMFDCQYYCMTDIELGWARPIYPCLYLKMEDVSLQMRMLWLKLGNRGLLIK